MDYSREVALAVEMAETTVPHARSRQGEAERWLRVLRRTEQIGDALMALGMPDGPLESAAEARVADADSPTIPVYEVVDQAVKYAHAHGATVIGMVDLLFGVLATYGADFSRALYRLGITREMLLDQLTMQVEDHPSGYLA